MLQLKGFEKQHKEAHICKLPKVIEAIKDGMVHKHQLFPMKTKLNLQGARP